VRNRTRNGAGCPACHRIRLSSAQTRDLRHRATQRDLILGALWAHLEDENAEYRGIDRDTGVQDFASMPGNSNHPREPKDHWILPRGHRFKSCPATHVKPQVRGPLSPVKVGGPLASVSAEWLLSLRRRSGELGWRAECREGWRSSVECDDLLHTDPEVKSALGRSHGCLVPSRGDLHVQGRARVR